MKVVLPKFMDVYMNEYPNKIKFNNDKFIDYINEESSWIIEEDKVTLILKHEELQDDYYDFIELLAAWCHLISDEIWCMNIYPEFLGIEASINNEKLIIEKEDKIYDCLGCPHFEEHLTKILINGTKTYKKDTFKCTFNVIPKPISVTM